MGYLKKNRDLMTEQRLDAMSRFDLSGLVAWLPGGSGLLGSAVSLGLAQHGAHVIVSGRNKRDCEGVVSRLISQGLRAQSLIVDVSNEDAVEAAVDSIVREHGQLDICVNLAARSTGKTFDELTGFDWEEGMSVTSTGAFLVGRAAGRAMTPGGSIVQFSSIYGVVSPDPSNYPAKVPINPPEYGFAKAGVLQLVRYQAVHLGKKGVRVNAVIPGAFPGPVALANDGFQELLATRIPLGRIGEPDEIVGAVVFLCSRSSSFVTGSAIVVDGGWTAW
jgi:gluconate 5-dehydrogenase